MDLRKFAVLAATMALFSAGCSDAAGTDPNEELDHEEDTGETVQGGEELISSVSCKERTDKAYVKGTASTITVITVGGKPTSKPTGHAFLKMQKAAHSAGISLSLNSGFRTMAEQQKLYSCYVNQNCNNGNLAAKPGYSNHQSGIALDISTGGGAYEWMSKHADEYGFIRTVPSEKWHWEYKGGKDPGGPCSGTASTPSTPTSASSLSWVSPANDASVSRSNITFQVKVTDAEVETVKFFQGTLNFASATRAQGFKTTYSFKYTGDKTLTVIGYDADGNEVSGAERNVDVTVTE